MSYDVEFKNPKTGETVHLKQAHQLAGGTYALGGTTEAAFNITWNYRPFFVKVFGDEGIRSLYGLSPYEVINKLNEAILKLNGTPDEDYWKATEGNARDALGKLLCLAALVLIEFPNAVFDGD